jgi:hypothetical protein
MFCTGCGAEDTLKQRYCRGCGLRGHRQAVSFAPAGQAWTQDSLKHGGGIITMIAEYVRYKITDAARQRELIGAYDAAQKSLLTSPHCLGYELSQCS